VFAEVNRRSGRTAGSRESSRDGGSYQNSYRHKKLEKENSRFLGMQQNK